VASKRPLLRGLGVYHGKRGWGVSVEFDVRHGPVTLFSVGQEADGRLVFIASKGMAVAGDTLAIGNTSTCVDLGRDPGEWVDDWSASGTGHHWALSVGHLSDQVKAAASLVGVPYRQV